MKEQLRKVIRETMREAVLSEIQSVNEANDKLMKIGTSMTMPGNNLERPAKMKLVSIDFLPRDKKYSYKFQGGGRTQYFTDDVLAKKLKENTKSVNEGRYDADLDKIEAAVKNATSFMNVGSELKKIGVKYDFSTSMIPMYRIKVSGNTIAIVNKKYAAGAEREVKDIAIGLMENVIKESTITEAFKHIIHVDTPTQVVSKPIAAQIMALAKKGVRSKEIGLEMGFTGNAKLAADTFQKVKSRIYFELDKRESVVTEGAGKEAMGIAGFTGTRGDAVQAFIDKHELDAVKLYKNIKSANLKGRMNFVSALVGNDGNPQQRLTIKLHKKN